MSGRHVHQTHKRPGLGPGRMQLTVSAVNDRKANYECTTPPPCSTSTDTARSHTRCPRYHVL